MNRLYFFPGILVFLLFACTPQDKTHEIGADETALLHLGTSVPAGENREFSYTDKQDAYYYGRTHAPINPDWFSGWNVRTRRIFQDYHLLLDDTPLDRTGASVTVYPHLLQREFDRAREAFRMFDHQRVLSVGLFPEAGTSMSMTLLGESIRFDKLDHNTAFFRHTEYPDIRIGIAPRKPVRATTLEKDGRTYLQAGVSAEGFFIALDSTEAAVKDLLNEAQLQHLSWTAQRTGRMKSLIAGQRFFESNDRSLTQAIRWNTLTVDQLITRQTGYGIYAGLPWFNDYWGRDLFISLPGACLVTGQFDIARKILTDFARYQNTDEASKNYGRIPNRLRPDDIIYNTTDGTPRFVMALYQYVQYSGDTALIRELFPAVERATEGVLRYWTDEKGYLTHDDADTWMDARIEADVPMEQKLPWSPRGNRANDIQALWYKQLQAAAFFADHLGRTDDAEKWRTMASRLRQNFNRDFVDRQQNRIADRLKPDGTPDYAMRPNQLFALDLIPDDQTRWAVTRSTWESLVYPWGVASLSQDHENFHPYHENRDFYHKDAAYHNGTVWLWNSGIAIQRMLEAGQTEPAFQLFQNMCRMTLGMGAIGSLCENTDALPRPGEQWPKLSGTFLQAWSGAEFLRVWYEYFLGIRPDAIDQTLTIAPKVPDRLTQIAFREKIFGGAMEGDYRKEAGKRTYQYVFHDIQTTAVLHFDAFSPLRIPVEGGARLIIRPEASEPHVELQDGTRLLFVIDPSLREAKQKADSEMKAIRFCKPWLRPGLGALSGKDFLKNKRERER